MKIAFKHLSKKILSDVSINDLSKKLFQLGHEHEVEDDVFNMEFTPNRGDCLSLNGLLRDLKLFYEIKNDNKIYDKTIDSFNINFTNIGYFQFLYWSLFQERRLRRRSTIKLFGNLAVFREQLC